MVLLCAAPGIGTNETSLYPRLMSRKMDVARTAASCRPTGGLTHFPIVYRATAGARSSSRRSCRLSVDARGIGEPVTLGVRSASSGDGVQRLLTSKIVPAKRAHRFIEAAVGAL